MRIHPLFRLLVPTALAALAACTTPPRRPPAETPEDADAAQAAPASRTAEAAPATAADGDLALPPEGPEVALAEAGVAMPAAGVDGTADASSASDAASVPVAREEPLGPGVCPDDFDLATWCPEAIECDEHGCRLGADTIEPEGGSPAASVLREVSAEVTGRAGLRDLALPVIRDFERCTTRALGDAAVAYAPRALVHLAVCAGEDGGILRACLAPGRVLDHACGREALAALAGLVVPAAVAPSAYHQTLDGRIPWLTP
jgi:hypothetical protein